MDDFKIRPGDKVLLVGEGNFSFSLDFITLNNSLYDNHNHSDHNNSVEVLSTSYETINSLSEFGKRNVDILRKKGE